MAVTGVIATLAAAALIGLHLVAAVIIPSLASRKPICAAAKMVATGMLEEIAQAPFDS